MKKGMVIANFVKVGEEELKVILWMNDLTGGGVIFFKWSNSGTRHVKKPLKSVSIKLRSSR